MELSLAVAETTAPVLRAPARGSAMRAFFMTVFL
jgi:hypothetical protein